jgi:hypothetical protein
MLWLCGAGIYHLENAIGHLGSGRRSAVVIACATGVVLLARPLVDHLKHGFASTYMAYSQEETERDRLQAVGQEIQASVPEGSPIYVWAYDPGVYLFASRPPASRFTYPRSSDQMQEILADLAAARAHAVLVPEGGSPEFEQWCDSVCKYRQSEILSTYQVAPNIGPYQVWVRQARTPSEPSEEEEG